MSIPGQGYRYSNDNGLDGISTENLPAGNGQQNIETTPGGYAGANDNVIADRLNELGEESTSTLADRAAAAQAGSQAYAAGGPGDPSQNQTAISLGNSDPNFSTTATYATVPANAEVLDVASRYNQNADSADTDPDPDPVTESITSLQGGTYGGTRIDTFGLNPERVEIIGTVEFKPLRENTTGESLPGQIVGPAFDTRNGTFSVTPAARLLEIQSHVREITKANVKRLFQIMAGKDLESVFGAIDQSVNAFDTFSDIPIDLDPGSETMRVLIRQKDPELESFLYDDLISQDSYTIAILTYYIYSGFSLRYLKQLETARSPTTIVNTKINDIASLKTFLDRGAPRNFPQLDVPYPSSNYVDVLASNTINVFRMMKAAFAAGTGYGDIESVANGRLFDHQVNSEQLMYDLDTGEPIYPDGIDFTDSSLGLNGNTVVDEMLYDDDVTFNSAEVRRGFRLHQLSLGDFVYLFNNERFRKHDGTVVGTASMSYENGAISPSHFNPGYMMKPDGAMGSGDSGAPTRSAEFDEIVTRFTKTYESVNSVLSAVLPAIYDLKVNASLQNELGSDQQGQKKLVEIAQMIFGKSVTSLENNVTTIDDVADEFWMTSSSVYGGMTENIQTSLDSDAKAVYKFLGEETPIQFGPENGMYSSTEENIGLLSKFLFEPHEGKYLAMFENRSPAEAGVVNADLNQVTQVGSAQAITNFNDILARKQSQVNVMTNTVGKALGVPGMVSENISGIPETYIAGFLEELGTLLYDTFGVFENFDNKRSPFVLPLLQQASENNDAGLNTRMYLSLYGLNEEVKSRNFNGIYGTTGNYVTNNEGEGAATAGVGVSEASAGANYFGHLLEYNELAGGTSEDNVGKKGASFNGGGESEDHRRLPNLKDAIWHQWMTECQPGVWLDEIPDYFETGTQGFFLTHTSNGGFLRKRDPGANRDIDGTYVKRFWHKTEDTRERTQGSASTRVLMSGDDFTSTRVISEVENLCSDFADAINSTELLEILKLPYKYEFDFVESRPNLKSVCDDYDSGKFTMRLGAGSNCIGRASIMFQLMMKIILATASIVKLDGLPTNDRGNIQDSKSNYRERQIRLTYNRKQWWGLCHGIRGLDKNETYQDDEIYLTTYLYGRYQIREMLLLAINEHNLCARSALGGLDKMVDYFVNGTVVSNEVVPPPGPESVMDPDVYQKFLTLEQYYDLYSKTQLSLSTSLVMKLMKRSKSSYHLPALKDVTPSQVKLMQHYFFKSGRNFIRGEHNSLVSQNSAGGKFIMHVGLPNGCVESLQNAEGADSSSTIVRIDIHRKNILDNTVISSPNSYYFDTSTYILENISHNEIVDDYFGLTDTLKIDEILSKIKLYKIDGTSVTQIPESQTEQLVDQQIEGKAPVEAFVKKSIFENTIADHFLKMYCKVMLGLDFDEDVFQLTDTRLSNSEDVIGIVVGNDSNREVMFDQMFRDRIFDVLPDLPVDQSYNSEILRLMSEARRSTLFAPEKYSNRSIRPKLFDRVFSILVDEQDFLPANFEELLEELNPDDSGNKSLQTVLNEKSNGTSSRVLVDSVSSQVNTRSMYQYYATVQFVPAQGFSTTPTGDTNPENSSGNTAASDLPSASRSSGQLPADARAAARASRVG